MALEYAVSDNCGTATATVSVQSWLGSANDAQVVDSHHLLLRAGMVLRITMTAQDEAGNESTLTKDHPGAGGRPVNVRHYRGRG